ncbi:MAG: hypothetical protein A2X94_11250 [Bdellovibrionales bacterium GWB1_55_8]|nr:MAG: hypothetical protein A2X94_11250 [Bdellovibrionales bacterium GWB1_55_8]
MSPAIDNTFFNAVAAATIKTIRDLCQIDPALRQPFDKGQKTQEGFAVAGLIGLTSSVVNGSIVLCFPKEVFLQLMEKMIGENPGEITKENEDAAAELLNIIFGQAKVVLNRKGYAVQMAIPSVLRGGEVHSSYSSVHKVRVYPFETPAGQFYVEFLLNEHPKEADADAGTIPVTSASARAQFFKPIIDSTVKTLKIQCGLDAKPGKPFSRASSDDYSFDVAGIVGITSKSLGGSFMLSFDRDVFLKLVNRLLGEAYTDFVPGCEDAVSELVNIILGSSRAILNAQGHGVQTAIPTVIHGDAITSKFEQRRPAIVIPFTSEIGPFHIEITIEN